MSHHVYLSGPVIPGMLSTVRADIAAARVADPAAPVTVIINSEGGDVYEGVAIYNLLRSEHVDVVVSGMAASIASVIAMAGQHVAMYANSILYLHHAWTCGEGNAAALQQQVDALRDADRMLVSAYTAKSGRSEREILDLMDGAAGDGGGIPADRALGLGLIDEVLDPMFAIAAQLKLNSISTHTTVAASHAALTTNTETKSTMDPELTQTVEVPAAECGDPVRPSGEELVEEKTEKIEETDDDVRISELEKKVEELTAALKSSADELDAAQAKLAAQAKFRRVTAQANAEQADTSRLTFPEAIAKHGFAAACEKFPQLRADYMRAQIRRGSIR